MSLRVAQTRINDVRDVADDRDTPSEHGALIVPTVIPQSDAEPRPMRKIATGNVSPDRANADAAVVEAQVVLVE